jgi:uncharacterized protein YndB with AHSA1/START domain
MAGEGNDTIVLEHEVRIEAPPEAVFSYFTDPSKMVEWMGAEAALDPRPGGICRVVFRPSPSTAEALVGSFGSDLAGARDGGIGVMSGRFVDVEPPHRVTFTWGWEEQLFAMPPQSTSVEVSLVAEGDETVVRLVHRQLPGRAVGFHDAGWSHYLPRLALAGAGKDPGHDVWQQSTEPP